MCRPKRAVHEGQDLDTRLMEDLEHVLSRSDTRSPVGKGSTCGWGRASLRVRMGSRETRRGLGEMGSVGDAEQVAEGGQQWTPSSASGRAVHCAGQGHCSRQVVRNRGEDF